MRIDRRIAVAMLVALVLCATATPARQPERATVGPSRFSVLTSGCSGALTQTEVNDSIGGAYGQTKQAGFSQSGWPSQSTVDGTIWTSFVTYICAQSAFQSLLNSTGASNLSLQLYAENSTAALIAGSGGPIYANITFDWESWVGGSLVNDLEWWTIDISNGTVAGPATSVGSATAMVDGVNPYHAWGGNEFYVQSSSGSILSLVNTTSWVRIWNTSSGGFTVPTCTLPYATNCQVNVPTGVTIDPIASMWTGLTAGSNAGLAAYLTGYAYDAASPRAAWCTGFAKGCDYGLFYEWSPAGPVVDPVVPYSGYPHVAANDLLVENVNNTGICKSGLPQWTADITDLTSGRYFHTTRCMEFTPYFSPMILESPNTTTVAIKPVVTQQTPSFGSVEFYSGALETASGSFISVASLFPSPIGVDTLTTYEMTEYGGTVHSNTATSNTSPCGPAYNAAIATSCQTTTWYNSLYNYNFV